MHGQADCRVFWVGNHMLQLDFYRVRKRAYLYMALPVFCFLGPYIHSIWGVAFLAFGIISFLDIWKNNQRHKSDTRSDLIISKKWMIALLGVAVLWSFLGGQGNLFFQNSDWDCRNAIYRDLIYQDWPVIYETYDKALVYYVGYWLPTAAITKIIGSLIPVIMGSEAAFQIGNILLWAWTSIGIFLVELLLITCVKPKNKKGFYIILLILILFSGLDIIGAVPKVIFQSATFKDTHLEWWTTGLQFSSLTTCLFWVFNQAVVPWMAILCFIQEKSVRDYVFLGVCVFASGPIPFLGVFVYMAAFAINYLIQKKGKLREYFQEIFSISNVSAVIIFVPFILYYMSNLAINVGAKDTDAISFLFFQVEPVSAKFLVRVALFWIIEVGVYFVLLYKSKKHSLIYWVSVVITLIAPFVKIGTASDFVMRFTIPTIMLVAVMCMEYLIDYECLLEEKTRAFNRRFCYRCIILCLCIGSITPLSEIMRGYSEVMENGKFSLVNDSLVTFDQDFDQGDMNFITYGYNEKIFFKYIIGKNKI